jgi:protein-S-isoprenylcysteine O-methyltransferase Ste14
MRDWSEAAPIAFLWLAWLAYWFIAARNVKTTRRQESIGSRLTHVVPLGIGAVLIASARLPASWIDDRFTPRSGTIYWIGVVMVAGGLAFMVWARRHLGRNWSGRVALKQDHELIRTGPYGLVRHPIYTGLLLAILGTAVAFGQWRDTMALVLIAIAVWRKSRLEERYLEEIFPDYARYRAEVPALVPFVFRSREISGQASAPSRKSQS